MNRLRLSWTMYGPKGTIRKHPGPSHITFKYLGYIRPSRTISDHLRPSWTISFGSYRNILDHWMKRERYPLVESKIIFFPGGISFGWNVSKAFFEFVCFRRLIHNSQMPQSDNQKHKRNSCSIPESPCVSVFDTNVLAFQRCFNFPPFSVSCRIWEQMFLLRTKRGKQSGTLWAGGLTKMSEAHFVWSAATTLQTDSGSSKQFLNVGVLEKHVQLGWGLWEPWGNSPTIFWPPIFPPVNKKVEICRCLHCLCAFSLFVFFFEIRKCGNFV